MKRHLLVRLYPRAWRERYGEELSAQLEAQRPLRIGDVADLVRAAFDAHLHPLRRDSSTIRRSHVIDRRMVAARATAAWCPVAAVAITAVMVLMDFWQGHVIWYRLVGFPKDSYVVLTWFQSSPNGTWVRFFPFDELYDLALHCAMLAVALAGALIFAAVERKALRESGPSLPIRS
jgi:hypothetical protein